MGYPRNRGAVLLEAWRKEKGLTQARAATFFDMEPSPYSKIERGQRKPGRTTSIKFEQRTEGAIRVESWDEAAEQSDEEETADDAAAAS